MTEPPDIPDIPGMPDAFDSDPAPIPRVRELFALYMTLVTAALVALICVIDLDVLLLHASAVGLVGLISVVAPLGTVSIAAFTTVLTVYVVRRMPRVPGGQIAYDDYSSSSYAGSRGVLHTLLQLLTGQRTSRRLPLVSLALLLVCLPLAAGPFLPPTTPLIGLLADWQNPPGDLVLPVTTPPVDVGAGVIATATALPTIPGSGSAPTDTTTTAPTVPTATTWPSVHPTATATRGTATATPTTAAVIHFTVSPPTAPPGGPWTGCPSTPPPAVTLTLDNTQSTVAVSWQATAVETISGGTRWATIAPPSDTVPAGKTQAITVSPDPTVCQLSQPHGMSWHVTFMTTPNAGPSPLTFTYNVS